MKAICYELRGKCPLSFCQNSLALHLLSLFRLMGILHDALKAKSISEKKQSIFLKQCQTQVNVYILFQTSIIKTTWNSLFLIVFSYMVSIWLHYSFDEMGFFLRCYFLGFFFFLEDGKNYMDGNSSHKTTQFIIHGQSILKRLWPKHIIFYT